MWKLQGAFRKKKRALYTWNNPEKGILMFTRQRHSTLGHAENNSRLRGEGGQRPGEGALANGDALRVALRLRAEQSVETLRHSGRAQREPESITPVRMTAYCGLWIPGSRLRRAPE